jgi:predicted regulator of Ras-like GTPase activity (Roadblock/LC7/MglB family)
VDLSRVNHAWFLDFATGDLYVALTFFPLGDGAVGMAGLSDVLHSLAGRDGVQAALLLSGEGLPIEHAARSPFEPETVAALAATLAQYANRLGDGAGRGELRTAVLDFAGGPVVLARAGSEDWLALLARPGADIGPLLYDLRHHRPALAGLL